MQIYCVHKAAWHWASLKVQKGHTKVNVELVRDFYVENIHVFKVTTWYMQSTKCYRVYKVLPDAACLKVYNGHTKVKIKLGWNSNE